MGICGRLLSLYRREEAPVDKRGKACLANGELYTIRYSPHLRVKDVCIDIAKQLDIAPVALDFFTLMTTDCEHCLRPNRQIKQQCDKQNDHYLNPKRVLHAEEIASKVFFFRLAFKAVAGPDLKVVNAGAYEYFVMQCRWDYINGRINNLARKDHLTLLVLESIIRAHEQGISSKDVLDNPKRFGLAHLFVDDEYSCREIKSHLKKQLSQFKTAQNNIDKSKNSFLYVLEGVTDFGVTKIVVKKFYYQSASEDKIYPVEWEILISPNGLKKRRTYKDERNIDSDDTTGSNRVDEMISDYKDIEYLEIKQSESDEIIHISRQKGFLEVISVGKSEIKKESLITLIEGFYHLFVNQYKTLTKYEPGLELPLSSARQTRKLHIHGPIERKKVEVLLKAVETENGNRSGVHMIRRSRKEFNDYVLSFIHGSEIKHFEIVHASEKYGIKNGPTFDNMIQLLEFYKTEQTRFPTILTKYCPIPKEGLCALYDDQIVVEAPCVPSTSRPANPEYSFEYIGNLQLEKLSHTFTCGDNGDRIFKARWLKGDKGGCQEVFCRRIETSRAPNFRDKVVKIGESMAKLVHRNLVQFHGVQFNDDQNTYLALEWINAGTLDDYLKKEAEITVETILTFAAQIAEACMFLHGENYVHGWLAAHNVLIVNEEQVKLSDVSVPCLREEDMLCETLNINRSPWKARECFQGRRYSKESDVWAFGIVLWEMFMKTVPFQNMDDDTILQIFQQDRHLAYPRWCPEEVGKIMKSCWITEPTQRPTFSQIVRQLRQIMAKLTPQEKERKIPETVDEKFTIEPLNIKKDKPSLTPPDDNLPRTSSCGSRDNPDGAAKDIGSNEGSYMTDDSELDLIPEKESPEMLWSPEEIEMKKFERKYPRPTVTEDATYDRITQNGPYFEPNDQTRLLASEHDSFASEERPMNGVIMNEIQTALDDPMKQQERPAEVLLRDSTEDDPADDDEQKPLISKTTPSLAQPDAIFASLETMDHMGFLASQLGSEGTVIGNDSTLTCKGTANLDEDTTVTGNDCTVDSDPVIPEQESTGVPNEASKFFSGNLDPFAADSKDRANVIFSKLNSATAKNQEKSMVNWDTPRESKYVAKTRFETGYNSGYLDPMMLQQSPNSSYFMAGTKPGNNPSGYIPKKPKNSVYTPSSPSARTKSREQTTTGTRVDNSHSRGNQQASLSGMVEFSKLDPFATSSFATSASECREIPSNEAGLRRQQTTSMHRQPVNNPSYSKISDQDHPIQDGVLLSSFLDRDPMSEVSVNDRDEPSGRKLTSNKQNISPSANKTSTTYVSPYSLGSMAYTHNKPGSFDPGRTTFAVPKFPQTGHASNKQANRSGYVPMRGNFPRPIASNAERESTNQKLNPKSHDVDTFDMSFSERDPFSEAVGKENKVGGLNTGNTRTSGTPQDLKPRVLGPPGVNTPTPMGITGATFENLFSKSRETRSTGSATPGMEPQGFTSPSLKPPSLIPSSSPGLAVRVANPSVTTPQPSLPVSSAPSFGKPSLGNLALKLSESRQTVMKPGMGKQPTPEGLKTASLRSTQQQNRKAGSKKSGYDTVSKSKNPDSIKTSKIRAVDEQSAMPVNIPSDFASLSNQDLFSSMSQCSPTDMSNTTLNLPSSASLDPFASKSSGIKLVTEAESDNDPYQKIRGNNAEEKTHYVRASGLVLGNTSSAQNGGKDESTVSGYSKAKRSPPSKRNANSNYHPGGVSTSLLDSVSYRPTKGRNPVSEKPRAKTPELNNEVNVLETADISLLSQTSLEDLLSSMSFQDKGKMDEVKPSQEIELNDRPNQDSSTDRNIPETVTEHFGANEVRTGLEVDNIEDEGLTFDNRDPFAVISSSQPDLNRKSPQESNVTRNSPENERGEPQQDSEIVPEVVPRGNGASQGINLRGNAVVVTSYSNAPRPERQDTQVPSRPTRQENSTGSPPDGGNGRNPPPLGRKPNANRKVSDIGMDYAKVSIKPDENTSYDEPVPGAVGGVEPGPELPVEPVELVTDGDDDKIVVVDPFNMPPAKESIQKLEWKSGNKVGETFEESMKSHQIPFGYLTFGRELGQGAFGVVTKAKLTRPAHGHKTRPPMDVAVKCCKDDASEIYKNSFKQEAVNLMKLDNKFIVRFLGVSYNGEKNLLLVTELVPQGSLDKYLRDPKNTIILGNEVLLQFAIQITMGMQYLESKKLVHRDLAARNILVATESHVKISDFGLSRIYDDDYYRSHRENQRLPIRWLAPECLEQKKFTVYSDVWSLGVTLWEMFSYGKRPYEDWNFEFTSELIQALKSGKRLQKPPACLDDVYANIQQCWELKPLQRISFFLLKTMLEDILKDKYSRKPYFL